MDGIFTKQLVYMIATDGPVTIKKIGTSFIIQGKGNKATFSNTTVPKLTAAYKRMKELKSKK